LELAMPPPEAQPSRALLDVLRLATRGQDGIGLDMASREGRVV